MLAASVKKYIVRLSAEERDQLETMLGKGKHAARQLLKARILLKADISEAGEGWSDSRIVEAFDTATSTVERTRQRFVEGGVESLSGILCARHNRRQGGELCRAKPSVLTDLSTSFPRFRRSWWTIS